MTASRTRIAQIAQTGFMNDSKCLNIGVLSNLDRRNLWYTVRVGVVWESVMDKKLGSLVTSVSFIPCPTPARILKAKRYLVHTGFMPQGAGAFVESLCSLRTLLYFAWR